MTANFGEPVEFPSAMTPAGSRTEVFLNYLTYFRSRLVAKLAALPDSELRSSRLPSGWTPLELLNHVRYMEMRWLEWGMEGQDVGDPWGDRAGDPREGHWHIKDNVTLDDLVAELAAQAERSRIIIEAHDLADIGQPSQRWDGAEPASLERILFHMLQEYARHLGHLDIVCELAAGPTGE